MSEEVQTQEAEGQEEIDVVALKNSKDRILNESKEYKAKYKEAADRLANFEKQKLEQEGNLKALLDSERNAKLEIENKLSGLKKKLLVGELRNTFAKHAKDACDLDDLITNPIVKGIVEYDVDSLDIDEESVKKAVGVLREKKPHYFAEKKVKSQANEKPTATVSDVKKDDKQLLAEAIGMLVNK
jgi:hypothetical protein